MWMTSLSSMAWAVLSIAPSVTPDIPPPGRKTVPTSVVFEVAPEVAGARLVVTGVFGGVDVLEPGEPYPVRPGPWPLSVFALREGEAVPPDGEEARRWQPDPDWRAAHPRAEIPFRRVLPVPLSSPVASARHRVRILAVVDDEIRWDLVATERIDAAGEIVDPRWRFAALSTLAAVGIGGLIWLGRRRRPAAESDA